MNYRALFVAAGAAVVGFAAQAVEWSGAQVVTANVDDDVELLDQVEVTVASGSTFAINGKISGSGSIKLVGGGTLQLAVSNDFSGGAYIDTGVLQVLTGGALGTGNITVKGSTKAKSQLQFGELDAAVTGNKTISFPNNIIIENSGNTSHYQLQFGPHGADGNRKTLNLTGDITCNGDLYFYLNNSWSSAGNIAYYLRGDVTANKFYIDRPSIRGHVYGKLTVDDIVAGSSGSYGLTLYNQENRIARSSLGRQYLQCGAANVLGGLAWVPLYVSTTAGYLGLNSYSQVIAYMDSSDFDTATERKYLPEVRASGAATLTLTGGVETATFEGRLGTITTGKDLNNMISLRIAPTAGSFTQYFTGTNHQMNGTITVEQNGAAVFSGAESALTNVTSITVNGGSFTLDTEVADPLSSLTAITLDSTGTINLGARTVWVDTLTIGGATLLYADHATHSEQIAEGTVLRGRNVASGMSYTTVDLSAFGDWEVNVPAKSTNVVTVAQTGSGKITKKGAGYLLFETANDFTGGVQIDAGVVVVGHAGALGSGEIVIAGATKSACQLCIDTTLVQGTQTISNPITLQSDSATSYPALYFVLPATKAAGTPWTVTFTGGITANGNFCIGDNHPYNWQNTKWFVFDCPINAEGHTLEFAYRASLSGDAYLNGPVTAATLTNSGYKNDNAGGFVHLGSSENAIGSHSLNYNRFYMEAENALGDSRLNLAQSYSSANNTMVDMKGHDQHVRSLTSCTNPESDNVYITSSGSGLATLTIDGTVSDGGKTSYIGFKGAMSIVVDAREDDFVQTFCNRGIGDSTMTGELVVKRGTLKLTGTAAFANASAVEVSGGALEISTTAEGCFASAATLSVSNGATFRVTSGVGNLFANEDLSWYLESGATLEFADATTVTVHDLFVDGQYCPDKGSGYTHADFDVIPENLTITVTGKGQLTDADWVGGGADRLATTMENWQVNGATPSGLDLSNGLVTATLKSGAGMTFKDGTWIKGIINDIPLPDEVAEPVTPFEIAPENAGDTLYLTEGFSSDKKMQIVLGGHIAAAEGADPNQKFYYSVKPAAVDGIIRFSPSAYNGSSAALVLNGVTMDIPLEVEQSGNKMTMFSLSNTVNEINAPMQFVWYSSGLGAEENSVIRFHGGVSFPACYNFCGPGEIVIDTEPTTFTDGAVLNYDAHLTLDVSGNRVTGNKKREGMYIQKATLELTCDNAFRNDTQLVIDGPNVKSVIDLHATSQQVGRVNFASAADNTSAQVTGGYPSMIELTAKVRSGAVGTYVMPLYCSTRVTGGVGFHMNDQDGGTNVFTLAGRDFESCGDLMVSAGTMELAADATWLHGTNFTAKGEGVLRFAAKGQVNPSFATIHFEDNGKIYIPEGVTLSFAEGDIGGTVLDRGVYTGADGLLKDRIIGGGTLRIGKRGMMLFVQ